MLIASNSIFESYGWTIRLKLYENALLNVSLYVNSNSNE